MPRTHIQVDEVLKRLKDEAPKMPMVEDIVRDVLEHVNELCANSTMFDKLEVTLPQLIASFVHSRTKDRFSNGMATRIIENTTLKEGELIKHSKRHNEFHSCSSANRHFCKSWVMWEYRSLTRAHKENAKLVLWITAIEFLEKEIGSLWPRKNDD